MQVEFAVQLHEKEASEVIKNALKNVGNVEVNQELGRVVVETDNIPWNEIQQLIESTGRKAILTGIRKDLICSKILFQISFF